MRTYIVHGMVPPRYHALLVHVLVCTWYGSTKRHGSPIIQDTARHFAILRNTRRVISSTALVEVDISGHADDEFREGVVLEEVPQPLAIQTQFHHLAIPFS